MEALFWNNLTIKILKISPFSNYKLSGVWDLRCYSKLIDNRAIKFLLCEVILCTLIINNPRSKLLIIFGSTIYFV